MTATKKDTIYIDVDDEITSIIEKVHDSKSKITALVLPKRASVLQSTVNMRLLKRAGQESKKNIVLITSEAALLPLAGVVGLHVAKSLQSKPAIPAAPEKKENTVTIDDEEPDEMEKIDPKTPIGDLAGDEAIDSEDDVNEPAEEKAIDVDYDEKTDEDKADKKDKSKKNKKLKVPNFERFRLWIILGGSVLVILIISAIWAFNIAPRARIVIKTDTSTVSSTIDLTASPSTKAIDKAKSIIPATSVQVQKTETQQVASTGQKDNGTKATGTVTFSTQTNCITPVGTVDSGVTVTANSLSFVTSAAASFSPSGFSGGKCVFTSGSIAVTALKPGDGYNLSARSYSVSGYASVTASGSSMSGGTSKMVKIVSQADVDAAKQQLQDKTSETAASDLKKQLIEKNMLALSDGINLGEQTYTPSPAIGEEAENTTVTAKLTYTMLGVAQSDLKQLIESDVNQKIDSKTQQIQDKDDGIAKGTIKTQEKKANGDVPVNIQVQVTIGPRLDEAAIKTEAIGKKKGDALESIGRRPGVKEVNIQYSPFWVISTPKNPSKITVVFEKADGSQ